MPSGDEIAPADADEAAGLLPADASGKGAAEACVAAAVGFGVGFGVCDGLAVGFGVGAGVAGGAVLLRTFGSIAAPAKFPLKISPLSL